MTPLAQVDFEAAKKSAEQFSRIADRMNQEYPPSAKFPGLRVSRWESYRVPSMLGCSLDGISGRFVFAISIQPNELYESASLKLETLEHVHRFPDQPIGSYFTMLCCPLDAGSEEKMYALLKDKVLEPFAAS